MSIFRWFFSFFQSPTQEKRESNSISKSSSEKGTATQPEKISEVFQEQLIENKSTTEQIPKPPDIPCQETTEPLPPNFSKKIDSNDSPLSDTNGNSLTQEKGNPEDSPETFEGEISDLPEKPNSEIKAFWRKQKSKLRSGNFWADEIKKQRDNPAKRLETAIDNFPLPGAFGEAAVALRAIIKSMIKDKKDYSEKLLLLYRMAAIHSFLFQVQYIEEVLEPAYNVVEIIPKGVLESLSFEYENLGYELLPLLNMTDQKWLVEMWGEPKHHTTLHCIHKKIWDSYVMKLITKRWKENNKFLKKLGGSEVTIEEYLTVQKKVNEDVDKYQKQFSPFKKS